MYVLHLCECTLDLFASYSCTCLPLQEPGAARETASIDPPEADAKKGPWVSWDEDTWYWQ